jgi:hypothetical protein
MEIAKTSGLMLRFSNAFLGYRGEGSNSQLVYDKAAIPSVKKQSYFFRRELLDFI